MTYRRKADPHSLRRLFALGLLLLGIVLPFASAVLAPGADWVEGAKPRLLVRPGQSLTVV